MLKIWFQNKSLPDGKLFYLHLIFKLNLSKVLIILFLIFSQENFCKERVPHKYHYRNSQGQSSTNSGSRSVTNSFTISFSTQMSSLPLDPLLFLPSRPWALLYNIQWSTLQWICYFCWLSWMGTLCHLFILSISQNYQSLSSFTSNNYNEAHFSHSTHKLHWNLYVVRHIYLLKGLRSQYPPICSKGDSWCAYLPSWLLFLSITLLELIYPSSTFYSKYVPTNCSLQSWL